MRHFVFSFFVAISTEQLLAAPEVSLLTPQVALNLALEKPLKFIGFFVPADAIDPQIPSCLFRNEKVTVMYDYCTKDEQPALGITIHSANLKQGNVFFYAEGAQAVSKLDRKNYFEYLWFVSANKNASGYSHSFSVVDYEKYYRRKLVELGYGCLVSWDRKTAGQSLIRCELSFEANKKLWSLPAERFWKTPSNNWYRLQNVLRSKISALPNF